MTGATEGLLLCIGLRFSSTEQLVFIVRMFTSLARLGLYAQNSAKEQR